MNSHAFSHRVNRLLPSALQVISLGFQCRRGMGAQFKRHPLDFDRALKLFHGFIERAFCQKAIRADVIGENLDSEGHVK